MQQALLHCRGPCLHRGYLRLPRRHLRSELLSRRQEWAARGRRLDRTGGSTDIDIEQIRQAGLSVLARGSFRARGCISVPDAGVHSDCTYLVDLERHLALLSTATAMDPGDADEQPSLSEPVVQWTTREGLLVPLPSEDEPGGRWACVPGEPLIQGPLALLLWLVGAETASRTPSGSGWLTVVDVARALEHVPAERRADLQRSFEEVGMASGSQIELEVRVNGGAVAVDTEVLTAEAAPSRVLLHLSVDAEQPPVVPAPPMAGTVVDADSYVRALVGGWPDEVPVPRAGRQT